MKVLPVHLNLKPFERPFFGEGGGGRVTQALDISPNYKFFKIIME